MPITKSAKKKVRQDEKRRRRNLKVKRKITAIIKKTRQSLSEGVLKEAISTLDRAAKKKVIHKNKAARLKSRLSKLVIKRAVGKLKTSRKKTINKKNKKT